MKTPKGGNETSWPVLVDCDVATRLLKFAFAKPSPLRSNLAFCGEADMFNAPAPLGLCSCAGSEDIIVVCR